ncbi:MAG: hypothetical protein SOT07_04460 [Paludibacteraceae bacterium]|nr:hypothetical protein [Paludibacteraceae bacterium]
MRTGLGSLLTPAASKAQAKAPIQSPLAYKRIEMAGYGDGAGRGSDNANDNDNENNNNHNGNDNDNANYNDNANDNANGNYEPTSFQRRK